MGQDPYLFIVGCARSGTTLLHRIVDAHPHLAITPEIHWIANSKKKGTRFTPEGKVTKEFVSMLLEHKRFPQLEITREEFVKLFVADEISYRDLLTRIFEQYGKVKGKPLVGNKTPAYVLKIAALHHLWPEARFVHLIRDGRDVCLSIMNWKKGARIVGRYNTWSKDSVSTIALWWKHKVSLGREAGSQLGPELYHEIRYEDLMADPEGECQALCRFLAVPFSDSMVQTKTQRRSSKRAWLPITPGLRDWRSQMSAEDVERFEAAAGDLLDELNYPRAVPNPKPAAQEHASLIHDMFTHDARFRGGHLLPKGW